MIDPKQQFACWIVFLLWGSSFAPAIDDDTIHFHYDYQTAIKEAKATGRPIFLEFRCAP